MLGLRLEGNVVLGAAVRSVFPPVLSLLVEVLAPAGPILMSEKA